MSLALLKKIGIVIVGLFAATCIIFGAIESIKYSNSIIKETKPDISDTIKKQEISKDSCDLYYITGEGMAGNILLLNSNNEVIQNSREVAVQFINKKATALSTSYDGLYAPKDAPIVTYDIRQIVGISAEQFQTIVNNKGTTAKPIQKIEQIPEHIEQKQPDPRPVVEAPRPLTNQENKIKNALE